MRRVVEKVKDIVEICPFTHLHDFSADPGLTLAGYHFTDITADLMSKWIERVSAVRPGQGAAFALAGFRGVGKSHFLSVLGAIVSRPELRSRISDPHVASTAERLSRRHGPVMFVRRGSGSSLFDELKRAVGVYLEINPTTLSDSLFDLLLRASEQAGDTPLVLLIDTALGRNTRVARDDGALLSDIADAAKSLGVFVGVALDDDISGADGPNASISANFHIDYLDQEHLYKIVDSVIFTKHNHMRTVLHEIYEDYRTELPGFRWSEQRFTSLYPLHPAIVEIAPLIRLYIHDFALLGFAADAGLKILGRPANSLIGLDEVFDSVESRFRLVPDLADAFVSFDKMEREVIAKTPVLFRHPAKLILKGLFILSLNGEGVTASEIAAAMTIFNAGDGDSSGLDIEALLESFAEALPKSFERSVRDGVAAKYCFRLASRLDADSILSEAIKGVSDQVVWSVLLGHAVEKWADFDRVGQTAVCDVEWRGGIRRGHLIWPSSDDKEAPSREGHEQSDWVVRVEPDSEDVKTADEAASAIWRLAKLSSDEKDALRRYHLLHHDPDIRTQYGEGLSTAMHVHSIALEKIWQRIFLQDGYIFAADRTYKLSEASRSAHSLSQILTDVLAPTFELLYPSHPLFAGTFGPAESDALISGFLSGSDVNNADLQRLAECYAFPLGIAAKQGEVFSPVAAETLMGLEIIQAAFDGVDEEAVVPLTEISMRLLAPPLGLTREAQHILIAALVAQRRYEFVTSSGNRINHRSLDLQIIWDDIIGVAKPLNELYSSERLTFWAQMITGNSTIRSIDRPDDRLIIIELLGEWLNGWNQSRVVADFDELPDEYLNVAIWRTAANLRKSFGSMADIIGSLVESDGSLDQCLQLIADLFSDSQAEYEDKVADLKVLRDFTAGVKKRGEIATYLSLCENTRDADIEHCRVNLLEMVESAKFASAGQGTEHLTDVWNDFKERYCQYYAERHDAIMNSTASADRLKEIVRSDSWSAFESLASIQWLDGSHFGRAKEIIREMRALYCDAKVEVPLVSRPFCGCSFSLGETERLTDLPDQLEKTVLGGITAFRKKFTENADRLVESADSDAMRTSVATILARLSGTEAMPPLSGQEIRLLKLAAENVSSPEKNVLIRKSLDEDYAEIIPANTSLWETEVRKVEDFVNTEI